MKRCSIFHFMSFKCCLSFQRDIRATYCSYKKYWIKLNKYAGALLVNGLSSALVYYTLKKADIF